MTITNAFKVGQTNTSYSQNLNIVGNPAGLTFSGPWNLGGFTLALGSGNVAGNLVIISGVMSGGAGGITKFNPATLELTAANAYTGATTVNAGTLQLGDGTSLNGNVAGTITVTTPGSLVISNPLALTYSKVISGTGPVTKGAAGVLTLGAANTYAGLTTISGGTVKLGIANALPSGAGKGDVQLDGTLDMGAFSSGAGALNGAGTVDNSTGVATYTLTIAGNGDSGNFSGIIKNTSGTVVLTKTGAGSQILSGANTYAGNTIISAGTLQVGAANALPAASSVLVSSGATLDMNSQSDTVAALGGSGTVQNTAGTLTVNGNAATILTQNFNGFSCIAGTVSGSGSLVKGGTHAMAVRSDLSSYGGAISLTGGTLSVGAAPNRLPTTLALAVPTGALFQLDANNQTLGDLIGSGSVNLGGGILTVTPSVTDTFSGVIQNSELAGSSTALGHGLRGYYYTNIDFTGLGTVRDDSTVNLPDMSALPAYSPTAKTNQISVRWLGKVLTTIAGQYVFSTKCDDGARLWVGGTLLVDDPTTHGPTVKSGINSFAANTQYDIVMEYFNNTAGGAAQLLWLPPGDTAAVVIPSSNLLLPGAGTFVMSGSGTQKLGGANTYSGGTVVNAATLEVTAGGTLGSENVTVNGGTTLTLDSSASIASAADLIVNSSTLFVNLNYSGTDNIRALSLDGGATYQPAGTYGASASSPTGVFTGTGLIHVSAGPTTTTLVSSPSSPATVGYGTTVALTATVSGGATPSGTVTFYDGANWLGTSSLVSGVAMFSVNNLLVEFSPHSLTAVYSGDATHAASTSAAATVSTTPGTLVPTVIIANKVYDATTAATIASLAGMLPGDSNYVHVASYNATYSDKEAGTGKTVTIMNMVLAGSLAGEYTLSTAATNATANITPKALKVFNITAANKVYDATTAATITTTTAALGAAEAVGTGTTADGTNYIGDAVTLVTTGAVGTFADPNVANGKTVTINGLTLSGAQAGDYTVTSPTTTANITKTNSAGALTSSSNPSSQGANVTFTETLSAAAGTPTGGVTFWTNNVFLGTNILVGGVAATNTAALPLGSTTVQARYTGDVNFVGITNSLVQVVNAATTAPTTISNIVGTTLSYGGGAGAQFVLLGTNNVAAPLANWPRLATNTTIPGNFTIPAVGSAGPTFYRIKSE
jgi:autotransporter-associated beta strand protein